MNYRLLSILMIWLPLSSWGQQTFTGKVIDQNGEAIFAANVYPQKQPELGTTTNLKGEFKLSGNAQDTLICSFIGYKPQAIPFREINQPITIILPAQKAELAAITVLGKNPISEQFSIQKLERLDIYLHPVANADPLRAISFMAASTNTDESANTNLRGSSANRSRVLLDGVPIYNPVRNSQINGVGFFSLFNTEMLDRLFVYAGNPPLIYGNSSAGLVEIQMRKKVQKDQVQISAGLANLGTFVQKNEDNHHLRIYSNLQFSTPFIHLNKGNIPNLQSFNNQDIGLQYFTAINDQISIQLFSYGMNEGLEAKGNVFTYQGLAKAQKQRNFNIVSLDYRKNQTNWSIKHGSNFVRSNYQFGNIKTNTTNHSFYHAINYKKNWDENWRLQAGITHDYNQFQSRDSFPSTFYALHKNAPTSFGDTINSLHQLELYAYSTWTPKTQWTFSVGYRSNIPLKQQQNYHSYQVGINFAPDTQHRILLGLGQYHSFALPNLYGEDFELQKSQQIALDYDFNQGDWSFHTAIFHKIESGKSVLNHQITVNARRIFGWEFKAQYFLGKHCRLEASNIFIDEKIKGPHEWQKGNRSLQYFLKAGIQFNHPKWFNLGIVYMTRPGQFYTSVRDQFYNQNLEIYGPIFNETINDQQLKNYHRIDMSLSKRCLIHRSIQAIVLYVSINNVFNFRNQSAIKYPVNFLHKSFDYYQLRTLYFGSVFEF